MAMRWLMFLALVTAPTVVLAAKHCEYRLPQDVDIPLVEAHTVVFAIGRHSLTLAPGATAGQVELRGDACASSLDYLRQLKVAYKHDGDRVVVTAAGGDDVSSGWMGRRYAAIELAVKVPAGVQVEVTAGSGTVTATDVPELAVTADAGKVQVDGGKGHLRLDLGSGQAIVNNVGPLAIGALGSGTIRVRSVAGDVTVGSVGKGKLNLRDVTGSITVDTVGSGTVDVDTVGGNLVVHKLDADGDVHVDDVDGTVSLPTTEPAAASTP